MSELTIITPPAEAPVSLVAVKDFLRIGHDGEDTLVADLIASSTARLEAAASTALVTRTVKRTWHSWPAVMRGRGVPLRPGPATALASVHILDEANASTEMSERFLLSCGRLALRPWSVLPPVPQGGRIEAVFEAGFGGAEDVPEDLKLAVMRLVQDGYARGRVPDEGALPRDVEAILQARRGVRL